MRTKTQIQKDIDDFTKGLAEIEQRTKTLTDERETVQARIDARQEEISAAILDGRDPTKEAAEQARDKEVLSNYEKALGMAITRQSELTKNLVNAREELMMLDFAKVTDEAYAVFSENLNAIYAALVNFQAIETKLTELAAVGGLGITQLERKHPFVRQMRTIHKIIRNGNDIPGLYKTLQSIERYFPELVKRVRGDAGLLKDVSPQQLREFKF